MSNTSVYDIKHIDIILGYIVSIGKFKTRRRRRQRWNLQYM